MSDLKTHLFMVFSLPVLCIILKYKYFFKLAFFLKKKLKWCNTCQQICVTIFIDIIVGTTLNTLKFPIINPTSWRMKSRTERLEETALEEVKKILIIGTKDFVVS